ncbi:MAG: glycosyltransferase [Pyrinomonadaceae bacterium]
MKFALVSYHLPPAPSGQSIMLHRLLRDLDPGAYCLLTSQLYDTPVGPEDSHRALPGRLYRLTPGHQVSRGHRYGLSKVREGANVVLGIVQRARQIAGIVRREQCRAIVGCTGGPDLLDLPAAYLASRVMRLPFYPYYFDDYFHQWAVVDHWQALRSRFLARRLESALVKGAAGVIVPNEFMGEELRRRYGVESTVIHNPCDVLPEGSALPPAAPRSAAGSEVKIVYTGAVYDAHYDAFLNLVEALKLLGRPGLKLHIYTAHSHSELAARGIRGPVVYHDHRSPSAIQAIQREAALLFLPLAFESPYPELIKSSAPGKLGEYLAAGRPVLAHAPSWSFVVWYLRTHECGLVVDEKDAHKLAEAVGRVLDDPSLWRGLGARALEQARADFSVEAARAKFFALVT